MAFQYYGDNSLQQTPNIGSGFDASQLYNNSDQAYSDLMSADLDTMIEQDIPFGGFED